MPESAEVVRHKKVFFRSASVNYETAVPGTLRLVPGKKLEAHLRRLAEMQEMLFGDRLTSQCQRAAVMEELEWCNAAPVATYLS